MSWWIKLGLGLGLVFMAWGVFPELGWADTVTTKEGTTIEGKIVAGLPSVIAVETTGGTLQIKSEEIQILERASQDIITTKDGSVYKGTITTELPETLKIEVKTGVMEIKWEKVERISFGAVAITPGVPPAQATTLIGIVETKEGSQEQGIIYGFPNTIQIETSGGTLTMKKEAIQELIWGEPDTIKTRDGSLFKGKITTQMPEAIQLEMEAGTLYIKTANIRKITFTGTGPSGPNGPIPNPIPEGPAKTSGFGLGAGFSFLPGISFLLATATVEFPVAPILSLRAVGAYGNREVTILGTEVTVSSLVIEGGGVFYLPMGEATQMQAYLGAGGGVVTNSLAFGIFGASGSTPYLFGLVGVNLSMIGGVTVFTEAELSPEIGFVLRGGISRRF